MLRYASKLDKDLEGHLEKSKAFSGVSATFQNEILECALKVYRKEVVSQVEQAHFIAVIDFYINIMKNTTYDKYWMI